MTSFSAEAIAWSAQATVGHIAVASARLTGQLDRGLVDCQLSPAGKFRNGATRWWCVSHQTYWGVNADLARDDGCCRAAGVPLQLAREPLVLHPGRLGAARVGLVDEGIAVEVVAGDLCTAGDVDALFRCDQSSRCDDGKSGRSGNLRGGSVTDAAGTLHTIVTALAFDVSGLGIFRQPDIVHLNVTPPALAALASADGCIDCARCGYPHLDLGSFADRPHRRHTCGHCGHDATHSGAAIVSNPLYALAAAFPRLRFDAGIVTASSQSMTLPRA